MDKELIFSYRRKTAHTESVDAKHPKPACANFVLVGFGEACDPKW